MLELCDKTGLIPNLIYIDDLINIFKDNEIFTLFCYTDDFL